MANSYLPRLDIETRRVLMKIDGSSDCLSYESDAEGLFYATDGNRILIFQKDGFLMRSIEDVEKMITELQELVETTKRFIRR